MKTQIKIITLFILYGLGVWIFDTVIDYLFFYEEAFWEVLFPSAGSFEFYIRGVWFISFLLFGLIMGRFFAKHKKIEEALRESEEKYRQLVEHLPEAIVIHQHGKVVYANRAAATLFGCPTTTDIIGHPVLDFVHPDFRPLASQRIQKSLATGESAPTVEEKLLRCDESSFYAEVSAAPITFEGQPAIQVVVRDITEHKRTEEALRRSKEFSETVINSMNDAISIIDVHNYQLVDVNEVFQKIYGTKKEDLLGKTCYGVTHHRTEPCGPPNDVCPLGNALRTGKPIVVEHVHYAQDGSKRYVEVSASPLRNQKGEITHVVHVSRDITERKRIEEALRRAKQKLTRREKYLQAIIRDTPDAVVTLDTNHRIREWNPGAERLFGYTRQEALGRDIDQLISHPEVITEMKALTRHVFDGKVITPQDVVRYRKDGSPVHVTVAGSPVRIRGKIVGIVAVYTDITERKKAEAALKESLRQWQATFDAIGDAVYLLDKNHRILRCNQAMAEFVGKPIDEIVGRRCYELVHGTSAPIAECPMMVTRKTHQRQNIELPRDGKWLSVTVDPLLDDNGNYIGSVHIVADITEHRRLQQQLIQTDKLASLGRTVSGVAHELNNPLASILGFAQLLLSDNLEPDVRRDVETIVHQATRCQRIVSNLLAFARQHKPVKSYVNLNEVIESMLELRSYELRLNNIEVIKELDPHLPYTVADYHQLQQVFFNLVNNAEQAMVSHRGRGKLTVKTETKDRVLCAYVRDDGPGIPPDVLPKIFDPFFTTKEVGKGTGLGLSICYGIIQEHGGRIYAQSQVGQGTTFIIELPIVEECPVDKKPAVAEKREKTSAPKHILVVDDEDAVVEFVRRILSKQGHQLEIAKNGRMAWEKIKQRSYDAILLDLKMPKMSGQALFKKIEKVNPELSQKVIFMTGDIAAQNPIENVCLRKPFTVEQLNEALLKIDRNPG